MRKVKEQVAEDRLELSDSDSESEESEEGKSGDHSDTDMQVDPGEGEGKVEVEVKKIEAKGGAGGKGGKNMVKGEKGNRKVDKEKGHSQGKGYKSYNIQPQRPISNLNAELARLEMGRCGWIL